jgi:hypothetical protein
VVNQPFLPEVQIAPDPMGTRALAVIPGSYWGGQPGQVKLVLIAGNGALSERLLSLAPRRMTAAIRDEWIKTTLDPRADLIRESGVPRGAVEVRLREQLVIGDYLPDVERAMLGSDGAVWLKPFGLPDWLLLSSSGSVVARVRVPNDVTVYQVSSDRVWTVALDSDGLPVITRYRVIAR